MTDLEKILSNFVHNPVKLVDFRHESSAYAGSPVEYRFNLTAVPDEKDELIGNNFVPNDEVPFCDLDCGECAVCQEDCCDCEFYEEDVPCWGIPDVEYIIFNPPATIVFWSDGTKTVVKAMEGEKFEKYAGFAMACMKKMFGSTSRAKAIMKECDEDYFKAFIEEQNALAREKNLASAPKKSENKIKSISIDELVTAFTDAIKSVVNSKYEAKETDNETPAE